MTVILDYGVGNLFSLRSSFAAIGEESVISSDSAEILAADRIILPGVGAFRDAMEKLSASGLAEVLREAAAKKAAVHHSESYKSTYKPHYRIIQNEK